MSYLLRLVLPDRPGTLGAVATALGTVGADIASLDVVERGPGWAVDDVLVELPAGRLADTLLTAAQSVPGVEVESLRPYVGAADLHRDLELVELLAAAGAEGLQLLVDHLPGVFRAGWAVLLDLTGGCALGGAGAPSPELVARDWLPLHEPRRVAADTERWVPDSWRRAANELAAAAAGRPDRGVLLARPGGPRFRDSEVLRLGHLAGIAGTVADRSPSRAVR